MNMLYNALLIRKMDSNEFDPFLEVSQNHTLIMDKDEGNLGEDPRDLLTLSRW